MKMVAKEKNLAMRVLGGTIGTMVLQREVLYKGTGRRRFFETAERAFWMGRQDDGQQHRLGFEAFGNVIEYSSLDAMGRQMEEMELAMTSSLKTRYDRIKNMFKSSSPRAWG
jgi:hypothetical protein